MSTEDTSKSNQQVVFDLARALSGQANILTVPRVFITLIGDIEGALFFSQCLYWSDKGDDTTPEGWFYKTADEWFAETSLSYYQLAKYSAICADMGLLTSKVMKVGKTPTLHFKLNPAAIAAMITDFFANGNSAQTVTGQTLKEYRKTKQLRRRKTGTASAASAADESAENSKAALAPQTEGGYTLFNKLADEFKAKRRRPPARFGSLEQKKRFEAAEVALAENFDTALTDALSIPLLSLNKIVAYLERWGKSPKVKKLERETQAIQQQFPAAAAPGPVADYDSALAEKQAAARAKMQAAKEKAAA